MIVIYKKKSYYGKRTEEKVSFKEVVVKCLEEGKYVMEKECMEERLDMLNSYHESLKKKLSAIKTLEDEICELETDVTLIEPVISESTLFEISSKAKLNSINKFLSKNTKNENSSREFRTLRSDSVKLPKLQNQKLKGDPTRWQGFMDSFSAAVQNSKALPNVEKFNYLRTFLEGEAQHTISGLSLTNDNYNEALNLLKNCFGSNQVIISTYMNTLVKLPSVNSKDVKALQKFYDDVESHGRSLSTLGIEMEIYGALISTLILQKLPPEVKLVITRNIKENTWVLAKVLELINLELRARETCTVLEKTEGGKNCAHIDSELPYTGSSLHSGSYMPRLQSCNPPKSGENIKCIFCRGNHWSDKCSAILDFEARKDFFEKGEKMFFVSKARPFESQLY